MAGFELPGLDSQATGFQLPDLQAEAAFGEIIDLEAYGATSQPVAEFLLPDMKSESLSMQLFSETEIQRVTFVLDDGLEGPVAGHSWNPGEDMGREIGRLGKAAGNIGRQCQMVLCNVYLSMRRLSKKTLTAICGELPSLAGAVAVPLAAQAAALATRVGGNTIRAVFDRLAKKNFDMDTHDVEAPLPVSVPALPVARDRQKALRILVFRNTRKRSGRGSDESLVRRIARLEQHGLDLGDKYHDHRFPELTSVSFVIVVNISSNFSQDGS